MQTLTQNTLNTIQPKRPDTRLIEALQRNREKAIQTYKPTLKQALDHVNQLYYAKLAKLMPEGVRRNCETYNASLTHAAPALIPSTASPSNFGSGRRT